MLKKQTSEARKRVCALTVLAHGLLLDSVINAIDTCTLAQPSSIETSVVFSLMSESLYTYVKRVFYPSLRLEAAAASIWSTVLM